MTYKLEKITKQYLVSAYEKTHDCKKYPQANSISLLLRGGSSPVNGGRYYAMPMYETVDHLPFGDKYKISQMIDFDGLKVGLTSGFQDDVDEGVICLFKHLIRVLPLEEFDDRYVIEGVMIDFHA